MAMNRPRRSQGFALSIPSLGDSRFIATTSPRERIFRRQGFAGALLDWLLEEAKRLGCEQFHLDSGLQVERQDAHRLYFNKHMRISAYHFERVVRR